MKELIDKLYTQLDIANELSLEIDGKLRHIAVSDAKPEDKAEQALAFYLLRAAVDKNKAAIIINLTTLGVSISF